MPEESGRWERGSSSWREGILGTPSSSRDTTSETSTGEKTDDIGGDVAVPPLPATAPGDDALARLGGHRTAPRIALPSSGAVGLLLAAVVVAVCVLAFQWTGSAPRAVPDSYYPVQQSLHFAGRGGDLTAQSVTIVCQETYPHGASAALMTACRHQVAATAGLPSMHRQLFQMQPGFAIIAAPLVVVLGNHGVAVAAFLIGAACGILAFAAFRAFGVEDVRALAAEAIFLALPSGFWATRIDSHGAALLGILVALTGVGLLLRRSVRITISAGCIGAGLVWALVSRFEDGIAFTACLALALLIVAAVRRGRERVGAAVAGVLCVGIVLLWAATAYLLGLPGMRDAARDGLTAHFTGPAVNDIAGTLWHSDRALVDGWIHGPHTQAMLLLGAIAALIGLIARFRLTAVVWLAPVVAAALVVAARPSPVEAGELGALIWLPFAVGLAHVLDVRGLRRVSSARRRDGQEAATMTGVVEPETGDVPVGAG